MLLIFAGMARHNSSTLQTTFDFEFESIDAFRFFFFSGL